MLKKWTGLLFVAALLATGWAAFPAQIGLTEFDLYGNYSGYLYEYLEEITPYIGWDYKFVQAPGNINESLAALMEKLEEGGIDLMGGMLFTKALVEQFTRRNRAKTLKQQGRTGNMPVRPCLFMVCRASSGLRPPVAAQIKTATGKIQQALLPQPAERGGHGAAFDAEVVGQLLPIEGDGKAVAPGEGGLLRQVGEQLFAGRAPGKVTEAAAEQQVFVRQHGQHVFDQLRVAGTALAAGGYHPAVVEQQDRALRGRLHGDGQRHPAARRAGESFGEEVARHEFRNDRPGPRDVLPEHLRPAGEQDADPVGGLACEQDHLPRDKAFSTRVQAAEHLYKPIRADPRKERGGTWQFGGFFTFSALAF